jgi:hypothetical protein
MNADVNRRRYRRVGSKTGSHPLTRVRYSLLSDARNRQHEAPVLDMSNGGLCLLTEQEISLGLTVQMLVEPAQDESAAYRLLAVVRWSLPVGNLGLLHGLEFLPVSIAEARNRKGIRSIMESWEQRHGSA